MTNDPYQQQPQEPSTGGWHPVNSPSAEEPYDQSAYPNQPAQQPYGDQQPYAQTYEAQQQDQPSDGQPDDQPAYGQQSANQQSASAEWEHTGPVPTPQPYTQQSASSGWEHTGPVPTNGSYAAGGQPSAQDEYTGVVPGMTGLNRPVAPRESKPSPLLEALLDVGFVKFGTHHLASLAYLAVVATAVMSWIGNILRSFGAFTPYPGDALQGVGTLLLGWIPVIATIVVARILLEVAVSVVDNHVATKDSQPKA